MANSSSPTSFPTWAPTTSPVDPTSNASNSSNATNATAPTSSPTKFFHVNVNLSTLGDALPEPFYPEFVSYPVGAVVFCVVFGVVCAFVMIWCARRACCTHDGPRRNVVFVLAYMTLVLTFLPDTLVLKALTYLARAGFHSWGRGTKVYSDATLKRRSRVVRMTIIFAVLLIATAIFNAKQMYVGSACTVAFAALAHFVVYAHSKWVIIYLIDMLCMTMTTVFLAIPHGHTPYVTYTPLIVAGVGNLVAFAAGRYGGPFGPETSFPGMDESFNDGTDGTDGTAGNGSTRVEPRDRPRDERRSDVEMTKA